MSNDKITGIELSAEQLAIVGGGHTHHRMLPVDKNIPPAPPFSSGLSAFYGNTGAATPLYYNSPYGAPAQYQQYQQLQAPASADNHSYMPIFRV
jgi:hypothetical protein